MGRSAYREQDYAFGQRMLTLRSAIGLTQAGLADALGVSRRSVADWETGSKYPKADHLKHFVALGVAQQAFHAGQETEEIRSLWKAAHQKVLLDEIWLADLLSTPQLSPIKAPVETIRNGAEYANAALERRRRVDWDNALAVPAFFGREQELTLLAEWVVEEGCQLIGVLGLGGIGKSALAVHLMRQVEEEFDVVIWRSLRDSPTCEALIDDCLQVLAPALPAQMPAHLEQRLNLLLEYLRGQRVLIVLDNLETLLEEGVESGQMRAGYEDYERLLQRAGESTHQSCLLFTSREKPTCLNSLESNRSLVRILRLARLESKPCELLLAEKGVTGSSADKARLIDAYGGNPLALKIVTQTIVDIFDGEIAWFLAQGEIIFGTIRTLLAEQFARLSPTEQSVLLWLAILREPATLDEVPALFARGVSRTRFLEVIEALRRRSLIERGKRTGTFTLHSVVLEYATTWLITEASGEIEQGSLARLIDYGLCHAQAKEYVRKAQEQLLVIPLLTRLQSTWGEAPKLESRLLSLLDNLRALPQEAQGYGPSNLIALLSLLRGNLRGLDLSGLLLRGVSLHDVDMQDSSLAGATVRESLFTEPMGFIHSAAMTQSYWAVSTMIGMITVWREEGRTIHLSIAAHERQITTLAFGPLSQTPQLLASGSYDCTVKLWNLTSGQLIHTLIGHSDYVQSVDFSADGQWLASGSDDQSIRIWEVATGRCVRTIHAHSDNVYGVSWSPDGRRLASGGFDGQLQIWDTEQGLCVQTFDDQPNQLTAIKFSPDGRLLASCGYDHAVKIWELARGECVQSFEGHESTVKTIAWSPNGETIASAGYESTIRLWQLPYPTAVRVFYGHAASINAIAFSADGALLLSGSEDRTVRLWEIATGWCVRTMQGYGLFFYGVVWSADGRRLLSANCDATLTIWDATAGKAQQTLRGHSYIVYAAGWSPDGQWLSSGGYDQTIRIWDANAALCVRVMEGHSDIVYRTVWSPDGRWLASASRDCTVRIWDPATGQCRWIGRAHDGPLNEVKWSPDGEHLASCGEDRVIRLWRAQDGLLLQTLAGHATSVAGIAWSPDGRFLASCGGGGTEGELLLWDMARGKQVRSFDGQIGVVCRVAWSLDGAVLLSGGITGVIHWWDVASGASLRTRPGHNGWIHSLQVSPDGSTLVSTGEDSLIHLWDMQNGERIRTLRIDRPYERMDITGLIGITDAQRTSLIALGAIMQNRMDVPQPETGTGKRANLSAVPAVAESPQDSRDSHSTANLPFQSTSFIGRDAEITEIVRILSDPSCRLLTLVGPGGIGKTRLALEVAATQVKSFADGVFFVALASVGNSNQIVSAIADALNLSFTGAMPTEHDFTVHVLDYLRQRHLLLILDSFEHLLADADLVYNILQTASRVTLMVTSRERLNLQAEWLFDVNGLSYPPLEGSDWGAPASLSDLTAYSAVQLFVQRAKQLQPEFPLLEATLTRTVHICQHVAGMPLALELAAASVRTLPIDEIERQIRTNLDVFSTPLRDVPQRHRSLRAVFDHSWNLLSEPERTLLSRLAIFSGGWEQASVEAICVYITKQAGLSYTFSPILLASLVEKSLVRQENVEGPMPGKRSVTSNGIKPRYFMLEPIREYALEQLAMRGEAEVLQQAHANHFLALAEAAAVQWDSPLADAAIEQLDRERDNLRAGLQWALDGGNHTTGLRLAGALRKFWRRRGAISEGRAWLEALLAVDDNRSDAGAMAARLRAMQEAAWLASDQHDYTRAAQLFEQSLSLRRALGEPEDDSQLLVNRALQVRAAGHYQQGTALLEDVLARQRALGNRGSLSNSGIGLSLFLLGLMCREQGEFARARALFEESVELHRMLDDREDLAIGLLALSDIARDHGDIAQTRRVVEQSLTILRQLGVQWAIGFALNNLAMAAYLAGDLAQAQTLISESVSLFRAQMAEGSLAEVLITQGHILRAHGDPAAAYAALTEALRLAQAVGPRLMGAAALEGLALLTPQPEEAALAVQLLGAAAALRVLDLGTPLRPVDQPFVEDALIRARSTLGDEVFTTIWAASEALSLEEIISAIPDAAFFGTSTLGDA